MGFWIESEQVHFEKTGMNPGGKKGIRDFAEEKGWAPLTLRITTWCLSDSASNFISAAALLILGSVSTYKSRGTWGYNVV